MKNTLIIRVSGTQVIGKTYLSKNVILKSLGEYKEITRILTKKDIELISSGGVFYLSDVLIDEWLNIEKIVSGRKSTNKLIIVLETNLF